MYQIVEQTYEEKVKMYSKVTKAKLIEMLIESNRLLDLKYKPTIRQNTDSSHQAIMWMRQNGQ
jgi:hypothetical protein